MWLIGLTGGIACGKSVVGRFLAQNGIPVCDADVLAHDAMQPSGFAYHRIVETFGQGVLDGSGHVDRTRLGRRVFACVDERRRLETIVHPEVRRAWRAWAETQSAHAAVVAMVPLLFETKSPDHWDAVVCVAAPDRRRKQWLAGRGLSPDEIEQRIAAQMPQDEKMERADRALFNSGGMDVLREQTWRAWASLMKQLDKGGKHE